MVLSRDRPRSATAETEVQDQRGYIEEHAPDAVMEKLSEQRTSSPIRSHITYYRRLAAPWRR
jgi:hypothetical protein